MSLNLDEYTCEFCGGPGGHMKRKAEGRPIIPQDLEPAIEENKKV